MCAPPAPSPRGLGTRCLQPGRPVPCYGAFEQSAEWPFFRCTPLVGFQFGRPPHSGHGSCASHSSAVIGSSGSTISPLLLRAISPPSSQGKGAPRPPPPPPTRRRPQPLPGGSRGTFLVPIARAPDF